MSLSLHITRTNGFGRGKTEDFSNTTVTLGTDPTCSMRFDSTWDRTVSPHHATLKWENGKLWVEDTSTQGTFIDGRKIVGRELLPTDAKLELGRTGPVIQLKWEPLTESVAETRPSTHSFAPVTPKFATASVSHSTLLANRRPSWRWGAFAAAVVVLVALIYVIARPGSPDAAFAKIADENADGVALVVISARGLPNPIPCATAWAIGDHVYATNSHVTTDIKQAMDKGASCYLVINRHSETKLHVTRAVIHPRYGKDEASFDGKGMAIGGYDVGLLFTEEKAPKVLKVASRSELEKIDSGYRIADLGFPMEGMVGGGINIRNPVATMQSGIITSITDYWLGKADFNKRLLIQHNLGSAGGSSGSPLFNTDGEVVAILCAGNMIGTVSINETGNAEIHRAPSAVMVNYAQRVDLLKDIWDKYPQD